MKRIMITAAIAVFMFSAGNFTAQAQEDKEEVQMMDDKQSNDEFKPVELSEVPNAVKASVRSKMKNAKIVKAYKNEADAYKLELKTSDARKTVYVDENGKLMAPKQKKKMMTDDRK